MPSKDLTWNLFGRDVTASSAFKALGSEVEQVALRAKVHADEFDRSSNKLTADLAKTGAASLSMGVSFARAQQDAAKSIDALGSAMQQEGHLFEKLKNTIRDSDGAVIEFGKNASSTLPPIGPMFGLIAAGAVLAGPAVAAATGAVVGFGAAAGVSYLAVKGFQDEMKRGTPLGKELTASLGGLRGEFHRLEAVAATGASGGVLGSLKQLRSFLPTLEPMVGSLARSLGNALGTGTGGLITGLKVMAPLMQDAGRYAELLAQKFASFAGSPEFKRFIDYARQELPVVMKDLGDLAEAAIKLGVALQPVGDQLLARLDGLAKASSMLLGPFGKLTAATGDGGGLGGAFKFVTKVIDPIGSSLENLGNKSKKMTQAQKDAAAAAQAAAVELKAQQSEAQRLMGVYGVSASVADKFSKQETKIGDALALTTLKMQYENDAAGLLNAALSTLGGQTLNVAQAQTSLDLTIRSGMKTLADNKGVLNENTDAGLADRQAIEGMASSLRTKAQADAASGTSTESVTRKYYANRDALLAQIAKVYGANSAVYTYIAGLTKIPPIKRTTLDIQHDAAIAKIAATKRRLEEIGRMNVPARIYGDARIDQAENLLNYAARDRTAVIHSLVQGDARLGTTRGATGGLMVGGRFAFGPGGYVAGPGSGTSDSVLARVSNGEYVVRAAAVSRVGVPFMNALNRAGGGGVGHAPGVGGTHIEVHVHNAVIGNKDDLARTIVSALAPYYRNGNARP